MRRQNRKWVAIGVGLYLLIMVSAFRWSIAQRPRDGSLFQQIERRAERTLAEENAKAAAAAPQPTGETRLNAAGPAYVAARYDATHVVFIVATETESRFAASAPFSHPPDKISAAAKPVAPLAGLQELWEPDSQSLHFFPEIVQNTKAGEQWWLDVAPQFSVPVTIDRTVMAPTGCSLDMGFLATVAPDQQANFVASSQEYFAVRHNAVQPNDMPVNSRIGPLAGWNMSAAIATAIEEQLVQGMKQALAEIDARLIANAGSPGATASQGPVGHPFPRSKEWLHADRGLARGEGKLDYDVRAFRLTPDGAPRLFVRARWKLANAPVFLMTAWFKAEPAKTEPQSPQASLKNSSLPQPPSSVPVELLSADASWSSLLRDGEGAGSLGDTLDFARVLNEFDADRDGWAELLIHTEQGSQSTIGLYQYSDMGLAQLKTPLYRDSTPPASCVDP